MHACKIKHKSVKKINKITFRTAYDTKPNKICSNMAIYAYYAWRHYAKLWRAGQNLAADLDSAVPFM